eukprot:4114032-Pyramimonas_sp.AAC.1
MFGDAPSFAGEIGDKGSAGSGKGGVGAPSSAGAPQLAADEHLQLAALHDKLGDIRSAAAHRTAAAALRAPAPAAVSVQALLNKAHQKALAIEKKLESAVSKFEMLEAQLAAQKDQ